MIESFRTTAIVFLYFALSFLVGVYAVLLLTKERQIHIVPQQPGLEEATKQMREGLKSPPGFDWKNVPDGGKG